MKEVTTLKEELAKHIGETVFIGARSSFFFIGYAEEALSSLPLICLMLRKRENVARYLKCAQRDGEKLGSRKVKKVYDHELGGGKTIIIEGKEFGMFWTRQEYLGQKKALEELIAPMLNSISLNVQ
jgi:hypothetical protein